MKKFFARITALALSAVMAGTTLLSEGVSKTISISADNVVTTFGDINNDGKVNVLDSVYLKSKLLNQDVGEDFNEAVADLGQYRTKHA